MISECSSKIASVEWNLDLLGLLGTNGDDLHGEVILIRELSTGEEAKPLGPASADNTIASENTVDTNSVVKEVPSLGAGEVVNVVKGLPALDFHDLCTSETLPVEAKFVVEASELLPEQANKLDGVRSNVNVGFAALGETDDGGGQQVLESGIAGGEPSCVVYQKAFEQQQQWLLTGMTIMQR